MAFFLWSFTCGKLRGSVGLLFALRSQDGESWDVVEVIGVDEESGRWGKVVEDWGTRIEGRWRLGKVRRQSCEVGFFGCGVEDLHFLDVEKIIKLLLEH